MTPPQKNWVKKALFKMVHFDPPFGHLRLLIFVNSAQTEKIVFLSTVRYMRFNLLTGKRQKKCV